MFPYGRRVALTASLVIAAGVSDVAAQTPLGVVPGDERGSAARPFMSGPKEDAPEMPGVSDLFKPLYRDFRNLASRQNLMLASVGFAGSTAAHGWDRPVSGSGWVDRGVTPAFEPGQMVGSFMAQSGAALATYFAGRASGHAEVATLGAEIFRAQIVAQGTTQAVKLAANRTRPDGTRLSFPSGHAAAGFATASVLQSRYGWKVGAPAYAFASWIAASRIQKQRHYLSDVLAGATVGILAGRAVTIGSGSARFAVTPVIVPGGGGVNLVNVPVR